MRPLQEYSHRHLAHPTLCHASQNAGKENESVEVKYFESDAAWFKRIRQELGSGKGRSPHWLIFNDEAHHAYQRR
jgi:type III restriction enzyme